MSILVFSILTNFVYYCAGYIIQPQKKFSDHSIFFTFLVGTIVVSFLGLFLNFFFALDQLTNSLIYILIIVIFFLKNKLNINRKIFFFLILSSIITFLLIIKSNINRPDAGLYHLPFISILNEHKIFFGLSNIHSRFGHVSIMQYLSAINNNYIFLNNGISIPLASIVSFFYLYFFFDTFNAVKKKSINFDKIFSLFILIYIAYKITRYSSFGNDAVAHLSYFYLISCVLKSNLKEININKIVLISVFIFVNKPMLGLVFLIPLTIFLIQNNLKLGKIFNQIFSLPILFLIIWLIKNVIISGCAVYPIKHSCIEKLPWTNIKQIQYAQTEGRAWAKAWPDRIDKKISMEEFNKNFYWINAWKQKHLKYIINIILPYIIILLLVTVFIKIKTKHDKISNNKVNDFKKRIWLTLSTSLIGTFSFFLIFPIYRYGYSYLITLISLIFMIAIKKNIKVKGYLFISRLILILSILAFVGKQSQKIIVNNKNDLWPNIYTLDANTKKNIFKKQKIHLDENFQYFYANKGDNLCMYSKSPCTSYLINENVKHIKKFTFSIFILR